MAYCRWGDGDLYIYEDARGGLTCCGCKLQEQPPAGFDGASFNCSTRSAMIAHIDEHRAAGHEVQKGVVDALREEIAQLGDRVGDQAEARSSPP
jgi:hypothetical protein